MEGADMQTTQVDGQLRGVTAGEVEHFCDHGWAMLRGLVDQQLVQDLYERAKAIVDLDSGRVAYGVVQALPSPLGADPLFGQFALSSRLGEIASQLLVEPVAMRRWDQRLLVKPRGAAGTPTPPHQDQAGRPFKSNHLMFWLALDEVTSDMGSMWFLSGSHKLGLFGAFEFPSLEAAVERFPRLGECELTEAQHYAPGDATVHHGLTLHGTAANIADRARWGYRLAYVPADATFTGEEDPDITLGVDLTPGKPFDHPNFPIVYTP
jgi:hypothetical protein